MKAATVRRVAHVLLSLVAIVLLLAGTLKLIGAGAEDMTEGLEKAHLIQHLQLISVTAIVCGTLLIVPATRELGILMATAYWGGAIVAHLTYNDSVVMPAAFLVLLWAGVLLRSDIVTRRFADNDESAANGDS